MKTLLTLLALASPSAFAADNCDLNAAAEKAIMAIDASVKDDCKFQYSEWERTPTLSMLAQVTVTCQLRIVPIHSDPIFINLPKNFEVRVSPACVGSASRADRGD